MRRYGAKVAIGRPTILTLVSVALMCGLLTGGCSRKVEAWIADLDSSDEATRTMAVLALASVPEEYVTQVVPALLDATRDRKSKIAREAVDSLRKLGKPAEDELLLILVDEATDPEQRRAAATAAAGLGAGTVPRLLTICERLGEQDRRELSLAIAELGADAAPALAEGLTANAAARRSFAAATLALIGPEAAEVHDELVIALADEDRDVRTFAARALARIGPLAPRTCEIFQSWLSTPRKTPAFAVHRRTALLALVPHYVARLDTTDPAVRRDADNRLRAFGREAVPAYLEILRRKDPLQRRLAAARLTGLGTDAIPGIVQALSNRDYPQRGLLISTLVDMQAVAIEPMIEVLDTGHRLARSAAVAVLATIGQGRDDVIDALAAALDDEEPTVVVSTIVALSRMLPASTRTTEAVLAAASRLDVDRQSAVDAALRSFQESTDSRE